MATQRAVSEMLRSPRSSLIVDPAPGTSDIFTRSAAVNHSCRPRVKRPMKKLLLASCVIAAFIVVTGVAQEPPPPAAQTFEVATVKPNKSGDGRQFIQRQPGGRVTVTNMPLRQLITFAYVLAPFQLVGGPSWIASDHFDMVAKLEGNPEFGMPGGGPDPIQLAMRTLMADRFKLKTHRETREMDIYALVMVKPGIPGSALKPSTRDCAAQMKAGPRAGGPPPIPASGIMPC